MMHAFEDVTKIVCAKKSKQPLRLVRRYVERMWQTVDDPARVERPRICGRSFCWLFGG